MTAAVAGVFVAADGLLLIAAILLHRASRVITDLVAELEKQADGQGKHSPRT